MRRWLLGSTAVLLALLAGFIGYARHRARKALLELPHLLGADIRSETNGFTYSQSIKGRTLFTIHAAKAIQRQNGKTTLHDVQVTLYGEPGSNRVDSIRGAEFEYDQPNGVVRAVGETQLDLASPVGSSPKTGAGDPKRISVRATGLVFLEKLGVAATDGPIHFEYSTMSGEAQGADYDADTGVLQLRHDVHLLSRENGHVEKVDAETASFDRQARTVLLQQALLRDASDTLRAKTLHIQLRPEGAKEAGSIQNMQAEGGVELDHGDGMQVTAPTMSTDWAQGERPQVVHLSGGVRMRSAEQGNGTAGEAVLALNRAGRPERVTLLHTVNLATTARKDVAPRTLTADRVVANFVSARKPVLQDLIATGSARLTNAELSKAPGKPSTKTTITANTLHAFGSPVQGQWQVERVEGEGATRIEQAESTGSSRVSSGDKLLATFQQQGQSGDNSASSSQSKIAKSVVLSSLMQQGAVILEEHRPATPAGPATSAKTAQESRATANRVEYLASTGHTVLTGTPQITTPGLQIAADTIEIEQVTGKAEAQGRVRGSYLSSGNESKAKSTSSAETLHFLAAHATFDQNEKQALLNGAGNLPARLWSSTSQIEAPVIDLDQKTGKLLAHGAGKDYAAYSVRTVLPSKTASQVAGSGPPKTTSPSSGLSLVRLASRSLVYTQGSTDTPGTAQFLGGVRLDENNSQITAETAVAELQPASKTKSGMISDTVQRIVAQGQVRIQQPGRSATGERLQYSTVDQRFVLTGTGSSLPTVRDSIRGLVTGTQLIFRAGDDSVEVAGDAGRPVHTDVVIPSRSGTIRPLDRSRTESGKAEKSKQ